MKTTLATVCLLLMIACLPATAGADEYNPRRAGHPLQIIAYVLYPVGVTLDRLIFRPAWSLGQTESLRALFGFKPLPPQAPEPSQAPEPPQAATGAED